MKTEKRRSGWMDGWSWLDLAVVVVGFTVAVPDWFHRPAWGWLALAVGIVGAWMLIAVESSLRGAQAAGAALSIFGIALGLSGAVLFVVSIVRAVAFMDPWALIIGGAALVVGGLLGVGLVAYAVSVDAGR